MADTTTDFTRIPFEKASDWFDMLQKHARANYTKGWDWIVECVEFHDFDREIHHHKLDTWDKVLLHYTESSEIRSDRYDDVRSEAW